MIFRPKYKKSGNRLRPLSEGDIRSRLYGSAVGTALDTSDVLPEARPHKASDAGPDSKKAAVQNERNKIREELESLKCELEQAKRKLKRLRGVKNKKIRLLSIYSTAFLLFVFTAAFFLKHAFYNTGMPVNRAAIKTIGKAGGYAIQVAVYGDSGDARRFASALSAKGYKAFIRKSRFESGKEKFVVYEGNFDDKESAAKSLRRLQKKEGITDSFVVSLPE